MTKRDYLRPAAAVAFLAVVFLFSFQLAFGLPGGMLLVTAAVIGAYMAMNIGANDVANNVGPAVGSRAMTLTGAIIIAGFFEAAGALIAGGDVVSTIRSGIIDPDLIPDPEVFVWLMMAALLAGALWLNIATAFGAPVSTTHSVVGGVLGAGVAAGGMEIANWDRMGAIAASWVISPVMGGAIAAGFLYLIKRTVTYKKDIMVAARTIVPVLLAVMSWAFGTYLILKALTRLWPVSFTSALLIGAVFAALTWWATRPMVTRAAMTLPNDKASVNQLFTIPLIFAAALLSFAHGANDVANAVGPLAAVSDAILRGGVATQAPIPIWIMLIGAAGIALGLGLYGPRLIKTVGAEITELDQMRAFCIALAAAITVIIASQLGLPVSSTHIAVGGVFGVGFLREYLKVSYSRMLDEIESHHQGEDRKVVEQFLASFELADIQTKGVMLKQLRQRSIDIDLSKQDRKRLKKFYKRELVTRSILVKIIGAWIITVPASATMAAMLFFMLRGLLLDGAGS
ncbi:MAG: inorganic phosphate transporter [Pseudomonadales bacterium]